MRLKWFCRLCRVSLWVIAADLEVINDQRYHVCRQQNWLKIRLEVG